MIIVLMLKIMLSIIPIFFIMAAGYIVRRTKLAPASWVHVLNRFVYIIALPALIISSLLRIQWSEAGLAATVILSVVLPATIGLILALFLPLTLWKRSVQATVFVLCLLGNTIFIGIPVTIALYPTINQSVITLLATVQFLAGLFTGLLGLELRFSASTSSRRLIHTLMNNPLMIAFIIGLGLNIASPIRSFASQFTPALSLLAATASPLALFSLGMFWRGHNWRSSYLQPVVFLSLFKLVMIPIACLMLAQYFSPINVIVQPSVLLSAMPPAITAFVLAEQYRLDDELVAISVTITTLLSFITLPAIGLLIGRQ